MVLKSVFDEDFNWEEARQEVDISAELEEEQAAYDRRNKDHIEVSVIPENEEEESEEEEGDEENYGEDDEEGKSWEWDEESRFRSQEVRYLNADREF